MNINDDKRWIRFNGFDIYFLIITAVYILWRIVIFLKRVS